MVQWTPHQTDSSMFSTLQIDDDSPRHQSSYNNRNSLTYCGLVTSYGNIDLDRGQHRLGMLPDGTEPLPEPILTNSSRGCRRTPSELSKTNSFQQIFHALSSKTCCQKQIPGEHSQNGRFQDGCHEKSKLGISVGSKSKMTANFGQKFVHDTKSTDMPCFLVL